MAELSPGTVLGNRFQIAGVLGQGGMATVYLAHDQLRGERVALKVLHDHLTNTPSMRDRLRREVLAAGRIRHPNALVASDLHELDGHLVLSLPLHPGHTLAEHIETRGTLSADELVRVGAQLAGALAEAHGHGVVHRDITPPNVMIDEQGNATLTDFGLARLEDLRIATATGVVGTCGYAAPEVYQGERADPRSDVYSLGAVLYQAATGKPPFEAPNPMGVLRRQLDESFTPLSSVRPDLPPTLVRTIEAMLRRDPARRPQGARDVAERLLGEEAAEPLPNEVSGVETGSSATAAGAGKGSAATGVGEGRGSSPTSADIATGSSPTPGGAARGSTATTAGAARGSSTTTAGPAAPGSGAMPAGTAASSGTAVVRGLPPGEWTVVVKERHEDRKRRDRARRRHRQLQRRQRRTSGQRPEYEINIEALVEQVKAKVRALFDLPGGQTPEEVLSRAVALEAGLPEGALNMPEAMLQRHFRLVEAVDEVSARRLTDVANQSGFKARAVPLTPQVQSPNKWQFAPWPVVGLLVLAAVMPEFVFSVILMFFALVVVGKQLRRSGQDATDVFGALRQSWEKGLDKLRLPHEGPERSPLAVNPALRPHLARGFEHYYMLLEPRGEVSATGAAVTLSAGPEASPGVTTAAVAAAASVMASPGEGATKGLEPKAETTRSAATASSVPSPAVTTARDRLQLMVQRTDAQIDALERALGDEVAGLPPVVVEDLRKTLGALRDQSRSLGREAGRLQTELATFDDSAASAAATRIEARLKRLKTLQRAGDTVNEQELQALERGLEAHRRTLEGVEMLEGQLTQVQARLLEIGAAATQARRQILREKSPEQSALRLLEQLNGQVSAAEKALKEVEMTPARAGEAPATRVEAPESPAVDSESADEVPAAVRAAQARQRIL